MPHKLHNDRDAARAASISAPAGSIGPGLIGAGAAHVPQALRRSMPATLGAVASLAALAALVAARPAHPALAISVVIVGILAFYIFAILLGDWALSTSSAGNGADRIRPNPAKNVAISVVPAGPLQKHALQFLALTFLSVLVALGPLLWALVPKSGHPVVETLYAGGCSALTLCALWFGARASLLIPHIAQGHAFDFGYVMRMSAGSARPLAFALAPPLVVLVAPSLIAAGLRLPANAIIIGIAGVLTLLAGMVFACTAGLAYTKLASSPT